VLSTKDKYSRLIDVPVRRGAARTWYLVLLHLVMAVGHCVLCLHGATPLLAGAALVGWGFGSTFPLLVLVVAELFGTPHLASNYTWLGLGLDPNPNPHPAPRLQLHSPQP